MECNQKLSEKANRGVLSKKIRKWSGPNIVPKLTFFRRRIFLEFPADGQTICASLDGVKTTVATTAESPLQEKSGSGDSEGGCILILGKV
jgi:hypothetical protein